jgi:reverse transcriptase-like protein/integrase-like protein
MKKPKSILEWPTPQNCKDIEEFRGMAGYYRQYIKRFTDRMEALNERIRKRQFDWSEEEETAFRDIKDAYRGNQILIFFDGEKQVWVHADASNYAIGAEISQLDRNGKRRPVVFYSRKLLPAEMNYPTSDKEMLAIVQTFKKFRHLLQGTKYPVIVKSDHKNLRSFMTTKELTARQARWAEELATFDFRIEHIKGKENKVADALSRRADYREGENPNEEAGPILVKKDGALIINQKMKSRMVSLRDNEQELLEDIRNATKTYTERQELEEQDGLKIFNGMIFVPKHMETRVMERHHDDMREGHPGIARTMEKIQRRYYFPGMYRKLKRLSTATWKNDNRRSTPNSTMETVNGRFPRNAGSNKYNWY